jgi:hypothetical protein
MNSLNIAIHLNIDTFILLLRYESTGIKEHVSVGLGSVTIARPLWLVWYGRLYVNSCGGGHAEFYVLAH